MTTYQLRMYTVKPGEMAEWLAEWTDKIVPLRRQFGFEVVGAWTIEEPDRFVWIIGHSGPQPWEEVDRAYYARPSARRSTLTLLRHLASTEHWLMHKAGA